jgi:peptide/nickel transport system permease protein
VGRWLLARLLLAVVLLWCVASATFVLVELTPGDPADLFVDEHTPPALRRALEEKYCLQCPVRERYTAMLVRLSSFDLGRSTVPGRQDRPVAELIGEALPNTLLLSGLTLAWVFPVGAALGTYQALRRGQAADTLISASTLTALSTPEFVIAALPMWAMPLWLEWPLSGAVDPLRHGDMGWLAGLMDRVTHLVLPVLALGLVMLGGIARYTRAAVLEVEHHEFVRTARAKGLPEARVVVQHVLRNALRPVLVRLGLSIPLLASGALVIERVFALPGMGRLLVSACLDQDAPVMIGCLLMFSAMVIGGNLLADALTRWVDPRIAVR